MHQAHGHNPRTAQDPAHAGQPLPPGVRSLLGALRGSRVRIQDYREHLAEKYLGNNKTPGQDRSGTRRRADKRSASA